MDELVKIQKKYLSIDLDDYETIGREVDNKTMEVKNVCLMVSQTIKDSSSR